MLLTFTEFFKVHDFNIINKTLILYLMNPIKFFIYFSDPKRCIGKYISEIQQILGQDFISENGGDQIVYAKKIPFKSLYLVIDVNFDRIAEDAYRIIL